MLARWEDSFLLPGLPFPVVSGGRTRRPVFPTHRILPCSPRRWLLRTIIAPALKGFASELLVAAGVPRDEASVVAASLVGANLRGHDSHGVMRIPQYIGFIERGEYRSGVELEVEHETPALVVCDGGWGLGQVQAHRLLDRIIPKARSLGLAAGSARDCGHIGRLGEYADR